ncbi:GAF domain-containing protein [Luteitalea sp.]
MRGRPRVISPSTMAIPVRERWLRRAIHASQTWDVLIALTALVAGTTGVATLAESGRSGAAWIAGSCAVLTCVFTITRAVVAWTKQARRESLHELRGCLMTLHALLVETDRPGEVVRTGLRLTVHVPSADHRELVQVLDYVGDTRGGRTAGRRLPVHCGIAGHVYRTGDAYHAQRQDGDYEAYVRDLVEQWAYSEPQARRVDPASMSWMAVPLASGARIEGILYLDAREPGFFTESRQDLILRAAVGVARYVAERYA